MTQLDKVIKPLISDKVRVLWEGVFWGGSQQTIIGYGDFVYKRPGKANVEWFTVGLALQKNYISIYMNAADTKQYLAEKHKDQLGKAKVGKSSISFKSLDDINLDVLLGLVKQADTYAQKMKG